MLGDTLSTIGLALDILGVVVIFFFAPLQPDYTGGVPLVIAQGFTETALLDTTAVDITGSSLIGFFSP